MESFVLGAIKSLFPSTSEMSFFSVMDNMAGH